MLPRVMQQSRVSRIAKFRFHVSRQSVPTEQIQHARLQSVFRPLFAEHTSDPRLQFRTLQRAPAIQKRNYTERLSPIEVPLQRLTCSIVPLPGSLAYATTLLANAWPMPRSVDPRICATCAAGAPPSSSLKIWRLVFHSVLKNSKDAIAPLPLPSLPSPLSLPRLAYNL